MTIEQQQARRRKATQHVRGELPPRLGDCERAAPRPRWGRIALLLLPAAVAAGWFLPNSVTVLAVLAALLWLAWATPRA